ncbi:molybdopterin-guanine dinucleotide biosynthesis protein A [Deinococcus metalli]|uniref:Probable molybdenum cofactor guanylyltransferase n=1 Tax=Deinococcus metalli TaxID=1141878 RepID=A0A7W8KH03_9DEIO|nr:molybdenum cofactor guanylyltransferase [Deinococcus metalli]MBB5377638.1 molybdopterin-guanine dinucleotide biosynthesis protein A [Deinococcus metalli]GHF52229.1 putative molybdenum cofactor guanylyltransferase [Deinococcus metalli]
MTAPDFAAAITAGGRSSRYGSDKALAVLDGRTLLAHVAASLEPCAVKLLVAPPGRYALAGWHAVPDTRPGEGPLAGLEAALGAAPPGWVAFAGVDMPALTPAYWHALTAARTPGTLAVLALDGEGRPQPLAALYHTALRPHVTALLDAGERRLRLAVPDGHATVVAGLDARFFRNVNRPGDLEGEDPSTR